MTTISYAARFSPIGAIELKRVYQKNMGRATMIVAGTWIFVILATWLLVTIFTAKPVAVKEYVIKSIADLAPPPSVATKPPQVKVSQEIVMPKFTLPEAVPDEEVVEDFTVVSQEQLADISAPTVTEGEGNANVKVDIPLEEYLPTPDQFVPYEDQPVVLSQPQPKYPELARKAGIEGTVFVKVLIDKTGEVKDAIIFKESGSNAGFEESALAAAKLSKWKPAMQNKQPVAVWVSYPIKFTLK